MTWPLTPWIRTANPVRPGLYLTRRTYFPDAMRMLHWNGRFWEFPWGVSADVSEPREWAGLAFDPASAVPHRVMRPIQIGTTGCGFGPVDGWWVPQP